MNCANNKSSLEAAAEAAAKVNAMLIAKGKLKLPAPANRTKAKVVGTTKAAGDLFTAEVEINDAPISARNMLTRGHTQDEVNKFSGAAVSTRGRYMSFEDRAKNNMGERPLYLHVQASTKDAVDLAVQRIHEIIQQHLKTLPLTGSKIATNVKVTTQSPTSTVVTFSPPPLMSINTTPLHTGQLHFVQDKIFIGLEHIPQSFGVRDKILGPGASYLQHIRIETGATVTLRGKGSAFIEPTSGREAFEPLHIHITHPKPEGLQAAKELVLNLIQTVQQEFAQWQQQQTLAAAFAVQAHVPVSLQTPSGIGLGVVTTSIPSLVSPVTIPVTTLSTSQNVIGQLTGSHLTLNGGGGAANLMAQTAYAVSTIENHPSSTAILTSQPAGSIVSPSSFALSQPIITNTVHLPNVTAQQLVQQQPTSLSQVVTSHPSITYSATPLLTSHTTLQEQQQQQQQQQQQTLVLMSQVQQMNSLAAQTQQQQQQQVAAALQSPIIITTQPSATTLQQHAAAVFSQAQPTTQILIGQPPQQATLVTPSQQQATLITQAPQPSGTTYVTSQLHTQQQAAQALNSSSTSFATAGQTHEAARANLVAVANNSTSYLTTDSFLQQHQTSNASGVSQAQQTLLSQAVLASPQHVAAGYHYQVAGQQTSVANVGGLTLSTTYPIYRATQNEQAHKRHFTEEPGRKDDETRLFLSYQQKTAQLSGLVQPTVLSASDYLSKQGGLQNASPSPSLLMPPPPPPPPLPSPGNVQKDRDKQLMPPPSLPTGNKSLNEPERKRLKGALGSVAIYGSSDEEDEDNGPMCISRLRQVAKSKGYFTGGVKLPGYGSSSSSITSHAHQHMFTSAGKSGQNHLYGSPSHHHARQNVPFWMAPN